MLYNIPWSTRFFRYGRTQCKRHTIVFERLDYQHTNTIIDTITTVHRPYEGNSNTTHLATQ